ncbi:MAG: hypothetical protein ACOX4L_03825 [Bacillota bacterium]|jgi:hypothetical protein
MTLKEFMEKADSLIIIKEAAKCESKEELKGFFVNRGVTVTEDETEKLYAMLSKSKVTELSDEELDGITGGGWYYKIEDCPRGHTKIVIWVFGDNNRYVDENCLFCKYISQEEKVNPKCTRRSEIEYWEGPPWEW